MKLLSRIRNIARISRMDSADVARAWEARNLDGAAPEATGADRPGQTVTTAFACIVARREAIAARPPIVSDAADNVVESGPLAELVERPNAAMDGAEFRRVLETHQTLHNACAIHIEPDSVRPELEPLHPAGLKAVRGVYGPAGTPRAIAWQYRDPYTREQREFAPEDVVVRRGYSPYDPWGALSPTVALRETIVSELSARQQNASTFRNAATPRGYLHSDQGMTREQAMQALDVWNGAYQGHLNAAKTAAVWGGLKYEQLQLTPAELDFINTLRVFRIDYYMAFRVYPAMLAEMTGETGLSQGSSTDSQRVAWWEDVGIPELDMIAGMIEEAAVRLKIDRSARSSARVLARSERDGLSRARVRRASARRGGKLYVWFNDAAIPALARQRLGRMEMLTKLTAAGYKPDDASEYLDLGLPPHPDNVGRVPFNLQEIGAEAPPPPAPDPAARAAGPDVFARLETAVAESLARSERAAGEARNRRVEAMEKTAAKRWSRFFVEQRGRVLARLQTLSRSDRLARAAEETDSLVFSAFPRVDEDAALAARLSPVVVDGLRRGWDEFAERTGVANPFVVEDPAIQAAIERRVIQGKRVNDTTENDLRNIFEQGFEAGSTVAQMADEVATYYRERCEGFDSDRAMNAAQTQTTGIVNDAALIAAEQAGGLRKYWIHAGPGADARPSHIRAAREYGEQNAIALEDRFIVDGEPMLAPGDPNASPANVCRCRCGLGFTKERQS
jgi:HK97 family phage portal protein